MRTNVICATIVMLAILAAITAACFVTGSGWPLVVLPFCSFTIPIYKDEEPAEKESVDRESPISFVFVNTLSNKRETEKPLVTEEPDKPDLEEGTETKSDEGTETK